MKLRSPKAILFTKPYELLLAVAMFVLGLVMVLWPSVLEHSAISFETRGVVHHIWHGILIAGGGLTLIGLLWDKPRTALRVEFAGLLLLFVAIAENMIAVIAAPGDVGGMLLAFRISTLLFLVIRCYALLAQPVIYVVRGQKNG